MLKIQWALVAMGFSVLGIQGLSSNVMAQSPAPNPPASQTAPQSSPVYKYISDGDRAYADGKYKESIESYTQALQLFNQNEYAYYNRGNAYRKLKDYRSAIKDYSISLQLNPRNNFSYLYRGMSFQANGEFDRAIVDYTALIKLDEQSAVAYHRRAEAYLSANQRDLAIADFAKASDLYKKLKEPGLSEKVLSQMRSLKPK
jgi:tetratricopeptide (TPR) repeat protein